MTPVEYALGIAAGVGIGTALGTAILVLGIWVLGKLGLL